MCPFLVARERFMLGRGTTGAVGPAGAGCARRAGACGCRVLGHVMRPADTRVPGLWAGYAVTSCDVHVLVYEAAEAVSS